MGEGYDTTCGTCQARLRHLATKQEAGSASSEVLSRRERRRSSMTKNTTRRAESNIESSRHQWLHSLAEMEYDGVTRRWSVPQQNQNGIARIWWLYRPPSSFQRRQSSVPEDADPQWNTASVVKVQGLYAKQACLRSSSALSCAHRIP